MVAYELFLSREGRIGRSEFLIGLCAVFGAGFVLNTLSIQVLASVTQTLANVGLQAFGAMMIEIQLLMLRYVVPLYFVVCIVPVYALVVKRCRDRGRAQGLAILFSLALVMPSAKAAAFKLVGLNLGLLAPLFHSAVVAVSLALLIWAVIELVCLRGRSEPESNFHRA